ncbi:hypothetical protein C1645_876420 [Glomus cerebriforme]|uniref:Uncharacterized protein n=1 Tax=Glomus cerebriforme TaxID=658196 RepID=A0A397T1H4_9GLOM|nr:hypothetical protein C1645_876420 [Glomus cerebriforme]
MTKIHNIPFFIIILPTHIFMLLENLVAKIIPNHTKLYISLGQYPTKVIYTRKEKGINYKVPNNYQVETTLSGLTVLCINFHVKLQLNILLNGWTKMVK